MWNTFQEKALSFPLFQSERQLLSQGADVVIPPTLLDQEKVLSTMEEQVQKNSSYSLLLRVPTFSHTLTTIDSIIDKIQKSQTCDNSNTLQLQSLKYTMVKYPDSKHPKEQYQVRVDIDFTASSQALARSFYDELLLSKKLVDSKNDVKWSVANGRYKTSFYLHQGSAVMQKTSEKETL